MDSDLKLPNKSGPLNQNQRLLSFLRDQKFVDCTFKVDGTNVKAHRLVLACSSPVFEKMLFGDMASDNVEEVTDINLEEFNQMLHFVYTGDVDIHSVINAWSLFYIAHKYLLDDLISICLDYVIKNVTMSTLVLSYEYSEMYNIEELRRKCFMDIIDCVNAVFTSDYHMKPSTLRSILVNGMLHIDSFELAYGIVDWGVTECNYRQVQVSPANVIDILKTENILEFMYKDWFNTQCDTCEETLVMCQCVSEMDHKILVHLADEVGRCNIHDDSIPKQCRIVPFSDNCKHRHVYKIARRLDLDETEEFVSHISVNRRTVILGFLLETLMNLGICDLFYQGWISVTVCDKTEKTTTQCCKQTTVKQLFCYNSRHYVPLKTAVTFEPDEIYEIRISYKNYATLISSVTCYYMSDNLHDKTKNSNILFYDNIGSVIRGVAFYPA